MNYGSFGTGRQTTQCYLNISTDAGGGTIVTNSLRLGVSPGGYF
jgi:hypothetical protein